MKGAYQTHHLVQSCAEIRPNEETNPGNLSRQSGWSVASISKSKKRSRVNRRVSVCVCSWRTCVHESVCECVRVCVCVHDDRTTHFRLVHVKQKAVVDRVRRMLLRLHILISDHFQQCLDRLCLVLENL